MPPDADWDPQTVALYTQAVIQGAFILAKAQGSAAIAAQCIARSCAPMATLLARRMGCAPTPLRASSNVDADTKTIDQRRSP